MADNMMELLETMPRVEVPVTREKLTELHLVLAGNDGHDVTALLIVQETTCIKFIVEEK